MLSKLFPDFERGKGKFPVHLCTIQNPREDDVMDSDVRFMVVIAYTDENKENPAEYLRVEVCTPYTAKELDKRKKKPLYGWSERYGDYYDHFERPIHLDDLHVVAWKRID